ncbi:hypothetical protein F5Y19DRAFT_481824 [Xylariaceae sp. FL1651]|nr:hypothetical protein F5Y19DRAFT_481824 [Xylariaceae sp. FL1651]
MSKPKKQFDLIQRGEKRPTPAGTLTFIGLRLADIPLQYALLSPDAASGLGIRLLTALGIRTVFTHASTSVPASLLLTISDLASPRGWGWGWLSALARLTPSGLLLLLMSAGSAAKQIYWQTGLSQESFPPGAAAAVSAYNTVVNGANALLFLALATTSLRSRPQVAFPLPLSADHSSTTAGVVALPLSTVVGALLYVLGMWIETASEHQRAVFKSRPENQGKVCKEGLWRWARHINYFGYALWRGGYCMVGSGWIGGIAMGLWQGWDLSQRAANVLDEYCSNRYKEQWVQFKKEVPYRIIPGVY